MKQITTFALGAATGMALLAGSAMAARLLRWTHEDILIANELFHDRSGLHFSLEPPPDPDRGQLLAVRAHPIAGLDQTVEVLGSPPEPDVPPGPCFVAHLLPPGPPERPAVVVTVLHPEEFALEDANGAPLALCAANGGTVPVNPP